MYGHIVSGYSHSRTAYLIPASAVVEDIKEQLGRTVQFPSRNMASLKNTVSAKGRMSVTDAAHDTRQTRHGYRGATDSGKSSSNLRKEGKAKLLLSTSQLCEALNTHRINTLAELRRIERVAADAPEEDQTTFQGPITSAWTYYVTSHQMLNELRNLTRNYPFSSDVLDDAKYRVSQDPESNRSWNYARLVLIKIRNE
jgi:hypothetical protein